MALGHQRARVRGLRPYRAGTVWGVLMLLVHPLVVMGQEPPNIPDLELEYRRAQAEYEAAFRALEAREAQLNQAYEALDDARAAGDEAGTNVALRRVMDLSGELREIQLRVDQRAEELRGARAQLLRAFRSRVDEFIVQVDSARNDAERANLAALLEDANNRLLELLAQEEPETVLEPMRDITISTTDLPIDIRRKAATLDYRADQHEARLADIDRRLQELREDQRRVRTVSDFLSDMARFGDTRMPVGPPGGRATNPPLNPDQRPAAGDSLAAATRPMTLEERIQSLEILRRELEERIQLIREKAERFRALAGGGVP